MAVRLEYQTRSDLPLRNQQKIYFCATEKDREKYFSEIADDLFSVQSGISIWYPEGEINNAAEKEAFISDLMEMNLFVVPVTEEFLESDNRARKLELSLAVERHIPILPLLQQQGLEMRFNEVCGNLQILNKYDEDPTALPYGEKLKSFLESVILKDETMKRIRQAFAAYIFLSYRKKDRKHAQKVMRLIHESTYTRDIAIWYDEFLTPGEDFNDSIRAAFEKSGLFSMVVTPNLLEKPNYVMTTEYPMAVEAGKKILPVMTVETDYRQLKTDYPGLPETVKADEENVDRIEKIIAEEIRISPNEDPAHKYLMGLAYLTGIDLETDHQKAVSLITEAADAGIGEAMQKLVAMYENGHGVARDYEKGAEWQQNYVEALEKRLQAHDPQEELRFMYFRNVREALIKWINLYKYDRAWKLLEKVQDYDSDVLSSHEKYALIDILTAAANAASRQKDYLRAEEYYEKARKVAAKAYDDLVKIMAEKEKKPERAVVMQNYYRFVFARNLAELKARQGKWDEAIDLSEEAISLYELVDLDIASVRRIMDSGLTMVYGQLADALYHKDPDSTDSLKEVIRYGKMSMDKAEGMINAHQPVDELMMTMTGRVAVFRAYLKLGELDEAEKACEEMLVMSRERYEKDESLLISRYLSGSYVFMSEVARVRNDWKRQAELLEKAIEAEEKVGAKAGMKEVARQIRVYSLNLLETYARLGEWQKHQDCTVRLKALADECYPDDTKLYESIGAACRKRKDTGSLIRAYECYEKAGKIPLELENEIFSSFAEMRKNGDEEKLRSLYDHLNGRYSDNDEGWVRLRDRLQSELAFVLCGREDIDSKLAACDYYQDLSLRYPEKELYSNNLRLTRNQIAWHYYQLAEKGDREAAGKAYELYSRMAEDYPEKDYGKNAAYVKNHFMS